MSNVKQKGRIIKYHSLYVLLDKDDKTFFVWYCDSRNVYDAFKSHYNLKFHKTMNWIESIKSSNRKPCIFVLEDVLGTRQDCYVLTLIWSRIFIENGFKSIESDSVLMDIHNIQECHLNKYDIRKEMNLNELLDCANCIQPSYQLFRCDRYVENDIEKLKPVSRKKKRVEVSLSDDEYAIIKNKAVDLNVKPTRYMIEAAMHNDMNVIDFTEIDEYTESTETLHKLLNAYLITLLSTDNYDPIQVEKLEKLIDELKEDHKEIMKLIKKVNNLRLSVKRSK